MRTLLARLCVSTLLALGATAGQAEPVTLGYGSTSTARHEYFVDDPVVTAEVQIVGSRGNWSLQRGISKRVTLADVFLSTGPAVTACCQAEVHDFVFGLAVAGITQQVTAAVRMTEIANDQYQFDMLDRPELFFDLGSLGVLSVDAWAFAFQLRANNPAHHATYVLADARLIERGRPCRCPRRWRWPRWGW